MTDDNSNAELGIAISQNKAAREKLDHAKGFERQHDWSIALLDERILGMSIMFVVVVLITVWAFEVPPLLRYTVTVIAGAIFVYAKSMATRRKKQIDEIRRQQVREHSKKYFR